MIQVGIIGGAGYTAGELIRLLVNHPHVELNFIQSESQTGRYVSDVHRDLLGQIGMKFVDVVNENIDVLYLCKGHGKSKQVLEKLSVSETTLIIDLSRDFRLKLGSNDFVYALPELNRAEIQKSRKVANPGCFATALQLSLLPLANDQSLPQEIYINAITGSTGAGQAPTNTTHFSWRDNNISIYKPFVHQHLDEVYQGIREEMATYSGKIFFVPTRGNFSRGIFSSTVLETSKSEDECYQLYEDYYDKAVFTHVSRQNISLKQVVNTNKCMIHLQKHGNKLLIISIIDNLLKGASGQAIQNMNIVKGLDERAGLRLKSSAY